jgi:hypothetical protein
MKAATSCVCGCQKHLHRRGKGCAACGRCLAFEAAKPLRTVDEEERQMALFEDRAHQRARIFDALVGMRVAGGATSGELAKLLKLNSNSVRGRLSEMEAEGVVIRTKYHRRGVRRESALYRVVAITNVAVAGEVDHEAAR